MIKQALWIAPAGAEKFQPCHFLARKEFSLDEIPLSLTLQIASDSNYFLEVNNQIVGRGFARGTRSIVFYDEYEIASFLRKGVNVVNALVVNMNKPVQSTQPTAPAVRIAAGNVLKTGLDWETYLCMDEFPAGGPSFTSMSGFAEFRNLNFDYHLSLPERAETIAVAAEKLLVKELRKRDIPPVLETPVLPVDIPAAAMVPEVDLSSMEFARLNTSGERLPLPAGGEAVLSKLVNGGDISVTLPMPENNGGVSFVVDFAKEVSGRVEITLDAPAGAVADIVYEEELYQGDRLRADHTHTNPSYQFCDRMILRAGRQTIGNLLLERGFRMIQLTLRNLSAPVTIHKIRAVDVRYPFTMKGQFFCSDYQMNRLWQVSAETVSACTTDIFTDCPWRERLFYCNDMVVENQTALKLFGDPAIHKRAIRMIFSQNRPDGLFTSNCPSIADDIPEGRTDFRVILSGNLTLPLILLDYYMHTGDAEMVKECFGQLQNMLARFRSWKDADGIITPPVKYWNFIDWSFELNGMEFNGKPTSLMNFLYIIAAKAQLKLAEAIGEKALESKEELDRILKNTVAKFYSVKDGFFLNSTEDSRSSEEMLVRLGVTPYWQVEPSCRLTHAMALLAGVDPALCKGIDDESLLAPELYYGIFLIHGFAALKDTNAALRYIRKYWGEMLDSGTPTLWENGVHKIGKSGFGGSASLCHGFSSSPVVFLQNSILGVSPLAPGFSKFAFDPQPGEITFARGTVPTPYGTIRASWQIENGRIKASLHVPENCTAETPAGVFGAGNHELTF
ncbi:MAG: hypothetical protein E7050_06225 [Lentisphaerae bacterium]|nr:hypothetical protein [Lentisphaerota bacterium]